MLNTKFCIAKQLYWFCKYTLIFHCYKNKFYKIHSVKLLSLKSCKV